MIYKYHDETDETAIVLHEDEQGRISGKPTKWRGQIPHPETQHFQEFEKILGQMSSADERILMLHLLAGNVQRVGFF